VDQGDELFAGIDRLARQMLAAPGSEYEIGMDTMGHIMSHLETEDAAGRLYMIWGHLTDQIDGPPARAVETEASAIAKMRRAATEWLTTPRTPAAVDSYLDRWYHEECGYSRT
jgi:hypothetical protein